MYAMFKGRKTESFLKNSKNFFFKSKAKSNKKRELEKELLKMAVTKLITTNWVESKCLFSSVVPSTTRTKIVF